MERYLQTGTDVVPAKIVNKATFDENSSWRKMCNSILVIIKKERDIVAR